MFTFYLLFIDDISLLLPDLPKQEVREQYEAFDHSGQVFLTNWLTF